MPEKLIIGADGQVIQHFGVKGMRWGVRKKYQKYKAKQAAERKKILTDKKYTLGLIKKDAVNSAIISGLAGLALSKAAGGSWADSAKIAAGSAAVGSTMSAGLNTLGYGMLKLKGG